MALTQISDVIVPQIFASYVSEESLKKNKLVTAGIVTPSPLLDSFLAAGGFVGNIPSFKHTDTSVTAALVPSDDPDAIAVAEKVTSSKQVPIRMQRNKVWSESELAAALSASDPLGAAGAMAAEVMLSIRQTTLLSVLAGTINETRAAALVNTIAAEATGSVTADTRISAGAFIDTLAGWGDNASGGGMVVMHSATYRYLQKLNLISFAPTNVQSIGWGTYLDNTVLVDDQSPVRAGTTSGTVYTTYIVRPGAIGLGSLSTANAVEFHRSPLAGNSGGVESLIVRDTFTYHVNGYAWAGATTALPTDAALATASNWTKVFDDKQVGVVALVHNV